jgi:SAM-dependent methyltransferase
MSPKELERQYAQVARVLRDGIIEHYRARGEDLGTPAGLRTLDTNTTLAARRGDLLLRVLARRGGPADVRGLQIADLGCGFGSLSLYLALAGAQVTGVDPNMERAKVSEAAAERLGLPARFQRGWMEDLTLEDAKFDLVVLNNSLCYIVGRADRRAALKHILRIMRPGAWAVLRNPSRMSPLDPFTNLPLVHQLPRPLGALLVRRRARPRSNVRLLTAGAASRELRAAGFAGVHYQLIDQPWWRPPRYQHHTARKSPL